jgi:hypothetical protein
MENATPNIGGVHKGLEENPGNHGKLHSASKDAI